MRYQENYSLYTIRIFNLVNQSRLVYPTEDKKYPFILIYINIQYSTLISQWITISLVPVYITKMLKPQDSFGIWQKIIRFFFFWSMHDFIDLYEL